MILYDRRVIYYMLFLAAYFVATALYILAVSQSSDEWLSAWFDDKFFVFQISTVYLVGCALLGKCHSAYTYVRMGTKRAATFSAQAGVCVLAFFTVNIMFSIVAACVVAVYGGFASGGIGDLAAWYLRYFAGLLLLSNLSLWFGMSNNKRARPFSQGLALLVLAVDVLVVTPAIKKISAVEFGTVFSWIFDRNTAVCVSVLLALNALVCFLLYRVGGRRDVYA
jgi:hypothetical protein